MIPRYRHDAIAVVWTDEAKLDRWGIVEDAVLQARVKLKMLSQTAYRRMHRALAANPPNIAWWLKREEVIGHDLAAFVEERQRRLPRELRHCYHQDLTSYDTEESAFITALKECCDIVERELGCLEAELMAFAKNYEFLPFLERTHGQGAKLRSFGGRGIVWLKELRVAVKQFRKAKERLRYSRIAGAIGNYGGRLSPKFEREALAILGLEPFYGSTQIMPRVIYASIAQSLSLIAEVIGGRIALDIRLGARSGRPICREPFGKNQKGSSAMPHKRNPTVSEQMAGMARLVEGYVSAIVRSIETWEARAIEQSCVERVAWPDLFHIIVRMVTSTTKLVSGLQVYPNHMLEEIIEARGTYASDEARNFLGTRLAARGLDADDAYRMVQLASFCAFPSVRLWARLQDNIPKTLEQADQLLDAALANTKVRGAIVSIKDFLKEGRLFPVSELAVTPREVDRWNAVLERVFSSPRTVCAWEELFHPSHLLRNERVLFKSI